tara:strand:- start:457 stop:846 length:390 start_codon:yes stop_codon:yes gene_type:complete
MSGLSVALPLTVSEVFGPYDLNTTFEDLAKQNLKMLILTNPGERIMYPKFGAGIRRLLFEPNTIDTEATIRERIIQQVSIHLPYITIDRVHFSYRENNPDLFPNELRIKINFTIVPLKQPTTLQIDINN